MRHWAHLDRDDGRLRPVDVLGWVKGRPVDAGDLRKLCGRVEFLAREHGLSNRPGSAFGVRQAEADGGIGWSSRTPRFAQEHRNPPVGGIPSYGGQVVGPEGEPRSGACFTAIIPGSGRVLRDLQQHLHDLKCAYFVRTGSKQGHFVPLGIRL
jgi:hypothetical protein